MDTIISIAAAVIAAVAAAAAVWQAREARQANKGAAKHEEAALVAQERAAAALEEQAALIRATTKPPAPWRFEMQSPDTMDQRWAAINDTNLDVSNVYLTTTDGADERWIQPITPNGSDVPAGAAFEFTFIRRLSSPTSRTVTIHWAAGDGPQRFTTRIA